MMFEAIRRYADFQGRASRSEYWMFVLLYWLVLIGTAIVGGILQAIGGDLLSAIIYVPVGLLMIVGMVPSLSVAFRRLHDTGRSAWWLLAAFIPFVGGLVLLVFYCLPGTPGENRFGPPPNTTQNLRETFA